MQKILLKEINIAIFYYIYHHIQKLNEMKRELLLSFAIATMLSGCATAPEAQNSGCDTTKQCSDTSEISTPDQAIEELIAGNKRFASGKMASPRVDSIRRVQTLNAQKPFAAIVSCSDSRVPVEQLFDQGIGDLFVIRTAGNSVAEDSVIGSIDYAIDHLEVPLVVVLGHQNCGGVTGAVTNAETGHRHNGKISELLEIISNDIPEYIGHPELLDEAIHVNADVQIQRIKSEDYVSNKIEAGKLKVISAYYNLETGAVEFYR